MNVAGTCERRPEWIIRSMAADHNLSALAGSLRRAGASGTMDQLRAKVYLALLAGQPVAALTGPETCIGAGGQTGPSGSGHGEPRPGTCGHGPVAGVNLTMPLATWLGLSDAPGHAAGYGPLDAADSRDLAARLAGQRGARWCITLTGEGGRPMAHGCARIGPGPSGRSRPPPRRSRPPRRSARGGEILRYVMGLREIRRFAGNAGVAAGSARTGRCARSRGPRASRPRRSA